MRHIVSFRHFLSTGRLGPLTTDTTLGNVARAIGPPQAFGEPAADDALPLRWHYECDGSVLEVDFLTSPPHRMEQLRMEPSLRGDYCLFGPNLLMTTDGIQGGSPPSAYLRSGVFDEVTTVVHLCETLDVTIVCGRVSVLFMGAEDLAESLGPEARLAISANFGRTYDFGEIDALLVPVEFRSHSDAAHAGQTPTTPGATCATHDYLAMLGTSR